ncbi:MAG: hypothetical protein KA310_03165 [Pseudomonadales bacterium]|nr:hypothetical protein [Pseudomonadales bacterium]
MKREGLRCPVHRPNPTPTNCIGGYRCTHCERVVCGSANGTSDDDDPVGRGLCDRCWNSRDTAHGERRRKARARREREAAEAYWLVAP